MDKMIDFTQYKNGDKVKSLEKELQYVDPTLYINGLVFENGDETIIKMVEVNFAIKGRAEVMRKLRKLGWCKYYGWLDGRVRKVNFRKRVE